MMDFFLHQNIFKTVVYYQAFSYVITTGNPVDKWRDIVKRVNHPAGLALCIGKCRIVIH